MSRIASRPPENHDRSVRLTSEHLSSLKFGRPVAASGVRRPASGVRASVPRYGHKH